MRLTLIVLALLLIASFSFADSTYLVKYYSDNAQSHACDPNSAECTYTKSVLMDSSYSAMCSSGVKVLGLSGGTNAHAEKNDFSNYDTNICMKSDIFTSNTCNYSAAGASCPSGYDCLFALSSPTNAHLSKCGVFNPATEIKFCCKSGVFTTTPPITIFDSCINNVLIENTYLDQNTKISFTCNPSADVNIIIFDMQGNILAQGGALSNIPCGSATTTVPYTITSANGSGTYLARIIAPTCSKDEYFNERIFTDQTFAIPDNNFAVAILVAFFACAFIIFSRNEKIKWY